MASSVTSSVSMKTLEMEAPEVEAPEVEALERCQGSAELGGPDVITRRGSVYYDPISKMRPDAN
eukprot:1345411-Pyramimonas_sp.AAC.3